MIKQLFLVAITISVISSCAITADPLCASCMLGICAYCRGGYYNLMGLSCKAPATALVGCDSYSSDTACKVCLPGYYLKNSLCVAIATANCAVADPTTGDCLGCKDGLKYDTVGKKCTTTPCTTTNCGVCTVIGTADVCTSCAKNYQISISGSTVACNAVMTNCKSTVPITGSCAMCEVGYYMKGTTCVVSGSIQKIGLFMMFFAFLMM